MPSKLLTVPPPQLYNLKVGDRTSHPRDRTGAKQVKTHGPAPLAATPFPSVRDDDDDGEHANDPGFFQEALEAGQFNEEDNDALILRGGMEPEGNDIGHSKLKWSNPPPATSIEMQPRHRSERSADDELATKEAKKPRSTVHPVAYIGAFVSSEKRTATIESPWPYSSAKQVDMQWYCCHCGMGPSLWAVHPGCPNCQRRACSACTFEEGFKSRD